MPRLRPLTLRLPPSLLGRGASELDFPRLSPAKDCVHHPYFRGYLFRPLWRGYNERLTPAGRGFFWATILLMHFALCSLEIQTYIPLCYAIGFWLVAYAVAAVVRPRVKLHARFNDRVCAGEILPIDLEITHAGGLAGMPMRVLPQRLPLEVDALPAEGVPVPDLRDGKPARVRLHLSCPRRGVYRLRGFRVETAYPFGLVYVRQIVKQPATLLVYPHFRRLVHLSIASGRRYQPGGVALASVLGDAMEYLGNREYRYGDSIRDIDWRATARLNTPIVREYREEYFLRAAVILDTHVREGAPEAEHAAFERAVSVCAAVSDFMSRQEYIVDLFAAGPNLYQLSAGRGLAYLDQILDILACVEENPQEPFAAIEPEIGEHLAQITTVVCVFLDWDETRRAFVRGLTEHGTAVKVIVVRDAACTLDPAQEASGLGEVPVISQAGFAAGVDEL